MKKSRFTDSQLTFLLRQAEEEAVVEDSRKAGAQPRHTPAGAQTQRSTTTFF